MNQSLNKDIKRYYVMQGTIVKYFFDLYKRIKIITKGKRKSEKYEGKK